MVTESQQDMFDKITRGELTAKQKGDFYFRMSKSLQKKLDELENISYLLDTIPLSYQNKIDLMKYAINTMDISEKLIERLDPAYPSPIIQNNKGEECDIRDAPPDGENWKFTGRRVVRHFTVDMKNYLPGIADASTVIEASYEPFDTEVAFLHRLTDHTQRLEDIREKSARNHKSLTAKEFNEVILPRLKKRGKNFKAKIVCIIGNHTRNITQDESLEQFIKAERSFECNDTD